MEGEDRGEGCSYTTSFTPCTFFDGAPSLRPRLCPRPRSPIASSTTARKGKPQQQDQQHRTLQSTCQLCNDPSSAGSAAAPRPRPRSPRQQQAHSSSNSGTALTRSILAAGAFAALSAYSIQPALASPVEISLGPHSSIVGNGKGKARQVGPLWQWQQSSSNPSQQQQQRQRARHSKQIGGGGDAGLKKRAATATATSRVPTRYLYQDGEWVPTSNWTLNGRTGQSVNDDSGGDDDYDDDDDESDSQAGGDSSAAVEATSSDTDADGDDDSDAKGSTEGIALEGSGDESITLDPSASSTDTLGWAQPTNAQLGVNLEDGGAYTTYTSSTIPSPSSSSSITATATKTAINSSATSTTTTAAATAQTQNFRADVPSGWVNDGRTAAYAVPVIIGVSVFLTLLIFALILLLVRSARKRRRARAYGMKLEEEGRGKSGRKARSEGGGGSGNAAGEEDGGEDMSRNARVVDGQVVYDEKARRGVGGSGIGMGATGKKLHARLISRRWSPANENASGNSLRRRKGRIARLLNRDREIVEEVIHGPHYEDGPDDTVSSRAVSMRDGREGDAAAATAGESGSQSLLRQSSNVSTIDVTTDITASHASAASVAVPSLRIDTSAAAQPSSPAARPASASASASASAAPRSSIAGGDDIYSVPLPVVGPPAYIHPPSPAYTSASLDDRPFEYSTSERAFTASRDEKRALLASGSRPASGAVGQNDPYREQRRYEHLYVSREGEAAEREQRSGAAGPSGASRSYAGPSSGFASGGREEDEEEEENVAAAARVRLQAHIAIDDKALLGRLREAGSAPDQPPSSSAASSSSAPASAPSAPFLDDADGSTDDVADDVDDDASASTVSPPSASLGSILPRPPKPIATTFYNTNPPPLLDEKARLRQAEEEQARATYPASSAPSWSSDVTLPYAAPSAPPMMDLPEASAPALDDDAADEDTHTNVDMNGAPSAPLALDLEDVDRPYVQQNDRRFGEGVV